MDTCDSSRSASGKILKKYADGLNFDRKKKTHFTQQEISQFFSSNIKFGVDLLDDVDSSDDSSSENSA